jgi:tetratricopeptide (TPR) repeat protein
MSAGHYGSGFNQARSSFLNHNFGGGNLGYNHGYGGGYGRYGGYGGYGGYGYGRYGMGYGGYGLGYGRYGGYGGYGGYGYGRYGMGYGGYGLGYGRYGGYYGGMFPGFGYGLGWGLGYGLGYGLGGYGYGYGYPYYGYGYGGYGGYGYPYAYGYSSYYPYGYGYSSYGYGYPYSNYGYGNSYYGSSGYPSYTSYASAIPSYANYGASYAALGGTPPAPGAAYAGDSLTSSALAQAPPPPDQGQSAGGAANVDQITAADFAAQGETNFKANKYEAAARNFRHALVDDPENPGVLMLLGQTAFALGQYNEAAGATELGMKMLPPEKWGSVLTNYQQLYPNSSDFTNQLRALEKARNEHPNDPALRFLLGYQYYYLGFAKEAFRELDKAVQLQPKDPFAAQLRNLAAAKVGEPAVAVPAVSEPQGPPPPGGAPDAPPTPGRPS